MMACNNNVTKGVMPMEKSQREIVVRGFSLVHDPEGSHYKRVRHDPEGSHYILEGEVRALAPGLKMGAA